MPKILSTEDVMHLLADYGCDRLEKIPDLLVEVYENNLNDQFPQATKWLEAFYTKMKVSIRKEFEDGLTSTETSKI